MDPQTSQESSETSESAILNNITKWQALEGALAPLSTKELEIIYKIEDLVQEKYYKCEEEPSVTASDKILVQEDYLKWALDLEARSKTTELNDCESVSDNIDKLIEDCSGLLKDAEFVNSTFNELTDNYKKVTTKTDFLHYLHGELMKDKKSLEEKQQDIQERLKYFKRYHSLENTLVNPPTNINDKKYINMLKEIDEALKYLEEHSYYKESYYYKNNYLHLLSRHLLVVLKQFTSGIEGIVSEMKYHDNKANLLEIDTKDGETDSKAAFSFYYGKFQNLASKMNNIIKHIESMAESNEIYRKILNDCEKVYFMERSAIISAAVNKSLADLKMRHIHEQSILFRLSLLFINKVCQDEVACYLYFFSNPSLQLNGYLSSLCQNLYDILRSSLISVKHLEVLTELCTIIKEILLSLPQQEALNPQRETMNQLLYDVQERIVYRSNVYFQNDIGLYAPSAGDLAYPEKLEQLDLLYKDEPNSSLTDLHSMWYPTVKRCLVCISRLYICLERQTFQSLAQEALLVCANTLEAAANQISASKTSLHGKLFQIKHLLIIREQIAPFQADFTIKEMSIDFGGLRTAAADLVHNRDKLFSLSNNAFLEFILKGTPKVKENFIDSRKEIDKQLKASCEDFMSHSTQQMVGNITNWIKQSEGVAVGSLKNLDFGKPVYIGELVSIAQKNIKSYIPVLQRYMKLYLANRDTEFILFRPIKNAILNNFIEMQQVLQQHKYSEEDLAIIACPSSEQLNVLISSVSLTSGGETPRSQSRYSNAS